MIFLENFFKRIILFIFYFDLGFTYFFKITLYHNFLKFKIYLITKNKLVKFYKNLNIIDKLEWPYGLIMFIYYYILELLNNCSLFVKHLKITFLSKLKQGVLKAPSLEIYYPLKTSIFSITLRITGVFLTLGLGLFFLIYLVFFFLIIL